MNQENCRRLDRPDLSQYEENRAKFPPEELAKYAGLFIAFSPGGKRILANGRTDEEMERNLIAAGIDPSQVVGSFVDSLSEPPTTHDRTGV
jgi:hypothetical protein